MFCPKCGTENPETGRFCRSCGTNLGNVTAALSGNLPEVYPDAGTSHIQLEAKRRGDPDELFGDAVKQILVGLGFLIVAIVLFTTGVAGGKFWWWAMLFPAFGSLGKGIGDLIKSKRRAKSQLHNTLNSVNPNQFPFSGNAERLTENQIQKIRLLTSTGRKIEAIKNYREFTGAGLADAKRAVEQIERQPVLQNRELEMPHGSIYDTGEVQMPPSVTEDTTRHLEINNEGETMTLPKK